MLNSIIDLSEGVEGEDRNGGKIETGERGKERAESSQLAMGIG